MGDPVRVTLLGTGTSTGIPVIGCDCRVCQSRDPRDVRTRCSALVEANGVSILIDAGPDFRSQALREGLTHIDAVLITHHHFDHVVGLDDLRPFFFQNRAPIPCFAPPETEEILRRKFDYIFEDRSYPGVPNLSLVRLGESPFTVESRGSDSGVTVTPIPARHGSTPVYGYRVGDFAYLTDTNHIPPASMDLLDGVQVLVLDALRRAPHATHFSLDEAVAVSREVGARETWFVHMTHSVLHAEEDAELPAGVKLAYDGLKLGI
ncbi:MAG: MBL fold metallo-hydrolase [Rhodothermales bacterium]|nr:MBL fold metallo-hydrolase [Rhodothermales bacterium]